MKRKSTWLLCNGVMAAAAYFGLIRGVDGALNVALFMVWTSAIISLGFHTEIVQAEFKKKGRVFPAAVTTTFDFVICAAFVWFGFWFTGIAQFIQMIMYEGGYQKAETVD